MWANKRLRARVVTGRRVWNIRLVLVYLSTIPLDSILFTLALGLVILRKLNDLCTSISRHKGSAIADIGHIADIADDQNDDGTAATSLNATPILLALVMGKLEEALLGLLEASLHCFDWVLRELRVSHDHLMELVSQEVSTLGTSMTVIDCEEAAPRPEIDLLKFWLNNVEDDGNPVFIVAPHHSLMGVGGVGYNYSVLLRSVLGWVVVLAELYDLLLFHLHILLPLAHSHLHSTVLNYIVRAKILLLIAALGLFIGFQDSIVRLYGLFARLRLTCLLVLFSN